MGTTKQQTISYILSLHVKEPSKLVTTGVVCCYTFFYIKIEITLNNVPRLLIDICCPGFFLRVEVSTTRLDSPPNVPFLIF